MKSVENLKNYATEKVQWSEIAKITEKAVLVGIRRFGAFADVWVPKSLIFGVESEDGFGGSIVLPVWFLEKNGF